MKKCTFLKCKNAICTFKQIDSFPKKSNLYYFNKCKTFHENIEKMSSKNIQILKPPVFKEYNSKMGYFYSVIKYNQDYQEYSKKLK